MTTSAMNDRLHAFITARLHRFPDLYLHLASAHCNGAALGMTHAEALDYHQYEHNGPGGIRNHDEADLSWDADQVATVLIECADMMVPADDESLPVMRTAVDRLMRRPNTVTRTAAAAHVHAEGGRDWVRGWDGTDCPDGVACTVYPRWYDVHVERNPEGLVVGSGHARIDNPADDIVRGLLAAQGALTFAAAVVEDPTDPYHGLLKTIEDAQMKLAASIAMLHPRLYPRDPNTD